MPRFPDYPGVYGAIEGELIELKIRDTETETWLPCPSEEDIARACREYDLDVEYTLTMIGERDRSVHTILINAVTFRQHIRDTKDGRRISEVDDRIDPEPTG